jgi:hypothetical protein
MDISLLLRQRASTHLCSFYQILWMACRQNKQLHNVCAIFRLRLLDAAAARETFMLHSTPPQAASRCIFSGISSAGSTLRGKRACPVDWHN